MSSRVGDLEDRNTCRTSTLDDKPVLVITTIASNAIPLSFVLWIREVNPKPKGINNNIFPSQSLKLLVLEKLLKIAGREKPAEKEKLNGKRVAKSISRTLQVSIRGVH
jgi:transcription elongation factor GreA-like protein